MLPDVSHLPLLNRQCRTPMVRTSTSDENDARNDGFEDMDSALTPDEEYMIRRMNLQAGLVDARGRALDVDTDEEADAEIRRELEQAENVAPAPATPTPPPLVRQPNLPSQSRTLSSRPEHGFRRALVDPSRYDDPQERKDRVHNYIITNHHAFYPAGTPVLEANRVLNVQTGRVGLVSTVVNATGEVIVVYQEPGWGLRMETTPVSRLRRLAVQFNALPPRPWVIS